GEVWQVRFQGGAVWILLPSRGAAYLHILLSHPSTSFSVADLVCRLAKNPKQYILGSAGTSSERETLTAYAARLEELREELEQAQQDHDLGAQEKIEQEIMWISEQARKDRGFQNRLREVASERDRIRKAVRAALRRTLKQIAQYDRAL